MGNNQAYHTQSLQCQNYQIRSEFENIKQELFVANVLPSRIRVSQQTGRLQSKTMAIKDYN